MLENGAQTHYQSLAKKCFNFQLVDLVNTSDGLYSEASAWELSDFRCGAVTHLDMAGFTPRTLAHTPAEQCFMCTYMHSQSSETFLYAAVAVHATSAASDGGILGKERVCVVTSADALRKERMLRMMLASVGTDGFII